MDRRLHPPRELSRRSFLTAAAAAAAGLTIEACSSGGGSRAVARTTTTSLPSTTTSSTSTTAAAGPTPARRAARKPGERWDLTRPEGTDLLPQIKHIVVLMMENHSYDNYFGMLGRGDGFTLDAHGQPTNACSAADGKVIKAFHMANTCQLDAVPNQAWNPSHVQWDNGRMDGFVRSASGPVAMGYWTGADIPFYYGMARTFPVCDRWFSSCLAQTYPNRRFLMAGTARGDISTTLDILKEPAPPNGTIMDSLNRHGIPWRDYYSDLPSIGLYLPVLKANTDKAVAIDQFFSDCSAGTLPAFSLVEPNFGNTSEENPQDLSRGESFAASVVNAVMASPNWADTVLIWTYDEHGGYYDHVPPPAAAVPDDVLPNLHAGDQPGGYDRYGIRVPAVVVSPFARKDYVSHVVHDHTSVLGLIEHKYNLPALTHRDGAADDLLDALDLTGPPAFLHPPTLPRPKNPTSTKPLCTAPGPIPTA